MKLQVTEGADRYGVRVAWGIAALMLVRIAGSAAAPLAFDEAYYWRWSKHLAGGYFDHPPMVAVIIRLGTMIAGDTQLGVRIVSLLLAAPATWAVWRSAAILFRDDRLAAAAALFFNLTLMVAVGTVIITPDDPLVVASAFVLFFLVKLIDTGDGAWWLAVGAAVGAALLSKYTAFFLGVSLVAWLLLVPEMRRWLLTPWPWVGGVVAFAIFTPVVLWNAAHHWVSFAFQFGRLAVDGFTLRYIGEYFAGQMGLATPSIFILGAAGLLAFLAGRGGTRSGRTLLGAMVWPLVIYLTWHSLHEHVLDNWSGPIFPALSIAAAAAVYEIKWRGRTKTLIDRADRLAVPVGLGMVALIYAQAIFGVVPLGRLDPTARNLGAGWPQLGAEIDAMRKKIGARAVLSEGYGTTSWLSFYLPSHPPVIEVYERIRWVNEPPPPRQLFQAPLLYVCEPRCVATDIFKKRFKIFEKIASPARRRRGVDIARYDVFRAAGAIGDPLGSK